jgi:tetratricopeptide (TPR) repeat protein
MGHRLLTLCAFLAPDDVPLEIFKGVSAKEGNEAVQVPDALASAAANPEALGAAAATLQAYALAQVRGGSFLSMHRLTQAIARDHLGDDERKSWAKATVMLMKAAFPFDSGDTRTWPPSALLLQHALTATEHTRALGVAAAPDHLLLNEVGVYLLNNDELAEAKAAFEKSIELCEGLLGPTHLALGPDHPDVAIDLNNIGNVLDERGDYSEARSHYERALTIFETVDGPEHANVAGALNNIGMSLYKQDDLESACAYYERALQIGEEVYGLDHPNIGIILSNLGSALGERGNVAAARLRWERALRVFLEHFGEKHPRTLTVKRHLEELDESAAGDVSSE